MEVYPLFSAVSPAIFLSLIVVISFLCSWFLTKFLMPTAIRIGLIDMPGGRKHHKHITPVVGGIAIYLALWISVFFLASIGVVHRSAIVLLVFGGALVAVGAADDRCDLNPMVRLIVQLGIAMLAAYYADIKIEELGALFSPAPVTLGAVAIPFTMLAVVGSINAVNMVDGLDGLMSCLTSVILVLLMVSAWVGGSSPSVLVLLATLLGVVLGFFVHNGRFGRNSRARVFMGDAGSMFLGFVIAYLLIKLTQDPDPVITPVTTVWLFALPLCDTLRLMIQRMLRRRSPFRADRLHLHHILRRAGLTVNQTVLTMAFLQILLGVCGLVGLYVGTPEWIMFYSFLAVFGLYYWWTMRASRFVRWRKRRVKGFRGGEAVQRA